ncbi:hypothetical protein [Sinorhizobium sp. RAC02]|uniref:hypothetical protein n=1 Tax=Sinorhizobium sp. RAC02 TaxID=1842534 RepID=UPI001237513B|nr:hypothetical protein [Sinorhizobium sp. RAC02]
MPATWFCCAVFALALSATAAAADSRSGASFPVEAAIVLENGEPIAGAAMYTIGEECQIFTREQHTFGLSLKVHVGSSRCLSSELYLRCASGECSFSNGRSGLMFGGERRFDVYEGSDGYELVLRRRSKIGSVLLSIPDFGPPCALPKNAI